MISFILLILEERRKKNHFKERVTDDFEPYRALSDIPKLESYIWNERKDQRSYGTSALRDRFQLLFSLSGVLRSDSIYNTDLRNNRQVKTSVTLTNQK